LGSGCVEHNGDGTEVSVTTDDRCLGGVCLRQSCEYFTQHLVTIGGEQVAVGDGHKEGHRAACNERCYWLWYGDSPVVDDVRNETTQQCGGIDSVVVVQNLTEGENLHTEDDTRFLALRRVDKGDTAVNQIATGA